jgi:hypothetical protein
MNNLESVRKVVMILFLVASIGSLVVSFQTGKNRIQSESIGIKPFPVNAREVAPEVAGESTGLRFMFTGQVYADLNCNATKDDDEKGVLATQVLIYTIPENAIIASQMTDSDGKYSISSELGSIDSRQIQVQVSPMERYQNHPTFSVPAVTVDKDSSVAEVNIPVIPTENLGACVAQ